MKYSVKMRVRTNVEVGGMINWLKTEVGKELEDWTFGLYFGDGITNVTDKVCFKTEEDKVKFILKWL